MEKLIKSFQQPFLCTLKFITSLGEFAIFVAQSLRLLKIPKKRFPLLVNQLFQVGVLSLPVVAMTGFSTGLVLAAQSFYQLSDKGLTSITGLMVAKAMLTELGPILTAFMITGRVGAAMCAELGSMQVTEQIDAIRSMSVNPMEYLIAPRIFSGIAMAPLLTIFSNFMGIVGGGVISMALFGMTYSGYMDPIINQVTPFDFSAGMIKSIVFGFLIVTICCYKGMKTYGGAAGVGKSTTESVVICYTMILFFNFFLTLALNFLRVYLTLSI